MTLRSLLYLACCTALMAAPAFAQEKAVIAAWPTTTPTNEVIVVTKLQPGKRQSCKLGSLTQEELVCTGSFGRKPVVYKPGEVQALITPRYHEHAGLWALLPVSIGGAIMWGAVLLNPITEAGAVTVGIVAAIVIISGLVAGITGDADTPDRLLYLADDQKLSVALRK